MRDHYWRMRAYAPYFDTRLSWFPEARGSTRTPTRSIPARTPLDSEHPEWILKDAAGNKLYIPFGCSSGTCPQYAADIGNPAFRQ